VGRTSRAVVMPGDGTWSMRELQVPDPPAGGAVLRVEAVGICHSDIEHFLGIPQTQYGGAYPSIAGHEIVGRIDTITEGARIRWGVGEGQRVAVRPTVPLPTGARTYGIDFPVTERSGLFGGYADYMELLPETLLEPLPDDVPAEELTIWEPLNVAVRWAGAVQPGDSVVIQGPGHLGLATVVAARAAGAERIFVTGTAADTLRLEAARRLGVEQAIDISTADAVERVLELTSGSGADVIIDAASGSSATVPQAMQMARRGATIIIGGRKDRVPVEGLIIDWIHSRGLTIRSGGYHGDSVKVAIELIRQGKVPTADLLGEVFPLEQVGDALALVDRKFPGRDAIRVSLRLHD
jgi:threonine dehydrogenase-like Zn-dependent dehydrogenase